MGERPDPKLEELRRSVEAAVRELEHALRYRPVDPHWVRRAKDALWSALQRSR